MRVREETDGRLRGVLSAELMQRFLEIRRERT